MSVKSSRSRLHIGAEFPSRRRVLLLGNSIVQGFGSSDGLGFRKILADETASKNEFVGPFGTAPYLHGAAGGTRAGDWAPTGSVGRNVDGWITSFKPDLVYLEIGTNDIIDAINNPGKIPGSDKAETIGEWILSSLVSHAGFHTGKNGSRFITFAAGTLPYFSEGASEAESAFGRKFNDLVDRINAHLRAYTPDRASAAGFPNVRIFDGTQAYNKAIRAHEILTKDGTHPDDEGYTILGRSLVPLFGGTAVPAPPPSPPAPPPSPEGKESISCDLPQGPLLYRTGASLETLTFDTVQGTRSGSPDTLLVFCTQDHDRLVKNVISPWKGIVEKYAALYKIPSVYLYALINTESGGDPRAKSADGGVGLMQITNPALKGSYSDEDLTDPDLNVRIGAKYVEVIIRTVGRDLPKICAMYNFGHIQTKDCPAGTGDPLWGMCNQQGTMSHITRTVLGANTYLLEKNMVSPEGNGSSSGSASLVVLAVGIGAAVLFGRRILGRR